MRKSRDVQASHNYAGIEGMYNKFVNIAILRC